MEKNDTSSDLDELNLKADKNIKKAVEQNGEKIVISTKVFKFNDYQKRQERVIMLTNKALYNIKGSTIKRRIELTKVKAVTIGQMGSEFLIHIPTEYDYRYSSSMKRNIILINLVEQVVNLTGQKIPFYFKEDVCLYNYATTKADKKKGFSRMPNEGVKLVDSVEFRKMLEGETKKNEEIRNKTETLFSQEKDRQNVTLDDFQVLKVLGAGGFGIVLLVEEKASQQWYAMKVIKKEVILQKDQLEHTKTEKAILEHENHPFLVNLIYVFQDPTRIFFVMQFMKGGELYQHMVMSRKFEESRARFYAAQLAMALGHLHSKNFVYRDLKLENILMDENGNVCLTDFGMAKMIQNNKQLSTFCGTPEYMPPELVEGKGCDKTTDWWALGILSYEMMFGLPPFYCKNVQQMFEYIKNKPLVFPEMPAVSKEGKDFISKCLIRDKSQRLGAKNDVKEITSHPWFSEIDFQLLFEKKIQAPFKPKVNDLEWQDNFDKKCLKMKPVIQYSDPNQQKSNDNNDPFKDF